MDALDADSSEEDEAVDLSNTQDADLCNDVPIVIVNIFDKATVVLSRCQSPSSESMIVAH